MKYLKRLGLLLLVGSTAQMMVFMNAPTYVFIIHGAITGICSQINWFFED